MFKKSFLLFSFVILSGCNSGDGGGSSEPNELPIGALACPGSQKGIVGCWVTEACAQLTGQNGGPIEQWGNTKALFARDGSFKFSLQRFNNTSCAGKPNGTMAPDNVRISYIAIEPKQDESGVEANQLAVTSIFGDEEPFDIQTLYLISDNYRLCLSENFMLTGHSLSVSQSNSQAIDFNSCLVRAESI